MLSNLLILTLIYFLLTGRLRSNSRGVRDPLPWGWVSKQGDNIVQQRRKPQGLCLH